MEVVWETDVGGSYPDTLAVAVAVAVVPEARTTSRSDSEGGSGSGCCGGASTVR